MTRRRQAARISVQALHDAFERNRLAGMLVFTLLFALGTEATPEGVICAAIH